MTKRRAEVWGNVDKKSMLQTIINFNDMFEGSYDKENLMTFHNISQNMKANRSRKTGPTQKENPSKYSNGEFDWTMSRARDVVARDNDNHLTHSQQSKLTDVFQKSQERIEEQIRLYNCRYQRLLEAITDMQIRDLIAFNRIKEQNRVLWRQLKEDPLHYSWDRATINSKFVCHTIQPIFERIDDLILEISETRNSEKSSQVRSRIGSPLPASKNSSPQPLSKNRSQIIEPDQLKLNTSNNSFQGQPFKSGKSRQSFVSSDHNTCSQQSKHSLLVEQVKKTNLQDTPESVKVMLSQSGIGVTNKMATTMFQKIDICQSLNVCASEVSSKGNGSVRSLKPKNRYSDDNQQ